MKIRYRIFLGFSLLLALGFFLLIQWIMKDVNVQPKKSMEEAMVDTANILAAFIEDHINDQDISPDPLRNLFSRASKRKLEAKIYEITKKRITMDVYITDKNGIVLFDSRDEFNISQDYSGWHDVKRTLMGKYGARTTKEDPQDSSTSVAYVAAPIYYQEEIVGVCTVIKAWESINEFIQTTRKKIIIAGIIGFLLVLGLSYLISIWITKPVLRLTHYARSVKNGKRGNVPLLGKDEIGILGEAFEDMRISLEGKKYIESYVQALTHQLKAPLSSICGAAEILKENPPEKDKDQFIDNIIHEGNRIHDIIDRLLQLSSLEQRRQLDKVESIQVSTVVAEISQSLAPVLKKKNLVLKLQVPEEITFAGETFLIKQALVNIVQNAIEFSPDSGEIEIEASQDANPAKIIIRIKDRGTGIPDYALPHIFERFYSLPRPESQRKSSGLGLCLVKEVVDLHGGSIAITNRPEGGTLAVITLPMK